MKQTILQMMKKLVLMMMALTVFTGILGCMSNSIAEEYSDENEEPVTLIVTATALNGRAKPGKRNRVEARFDYGDKLYPTGKWSSNYEWVEVEGGETGTVWVNIPYVTEEMRPREMINIHTGKVKIRKHPVNGKITGYLKPDAVVMIDQLILGWGHCEKGWINLEYLEEVIYGE